jgi:hypothetical protein
LAQPEGDGPGYNHDESLAWIKERYEWLPTLISRTLLEVLADADVRDSLRTLRERGWLDWHLLLAIYNGCLNYRARALVQRSGSAVSIQAALMELAKVPEPPTADPVPTTEFSLASLEKALDMASLATAERIGLDFKRARMPNVKAIQSLLGRRYGYFRDDCEHDDVLDLADG